MTETKDIWHRILQEIEADLEKIYTLPTPVERLIGMQKYKWLFEMTKSQHKREMQELFNELESLHNAHSPMLICMCNLCQDIKRIKAKYLGEKE